MKNTEPISFDDFDELHSPGPATTDFDRITDVVLSRRALLAGSAAWGASGLLASTSQPVRASGRLTFDAVAANGHDTVTLPPGYSWRPVVRWGDPLWSAGAEFDQATRGTGQSQELAFGDNNDGMEVFFDDQRVLLAVNNEYISKTDIYGNRATGTRATPDDVRKAMAGQGVSVVELSHKDGKWAVVKDSPFSRRITANTGMEITGPARGHDLVKTKADPGGTTVLGTWNNCGSGQTPWGTYLTCEENFNGYFSSSDAGFEPSDAMNRYGVRNTDWGYGWRTQDERFDISKHPNEPNRFGYVVEIDPWDPKSRPRKLTALGRFKHENAEVVVAKNGHVVVYMGDDERGEFLYRFVSDGKFVAGADNSSLLEAGKLYAARFTDDMRGEWVELSPQTTGMASQAEICINTRQAASAVGATTMDRPEWVAANPHGSDLYCCLTNDYYRGFKPNAGGDATPVGGPNPRRRNVYGQIVRWRPDNDDHTVAGFTWDLFVLAGNPEVHSDARAGSRNVTADNMFNSPDGLAFDSRGLLWIQTDGNYTNKGNFAGMGNNQMLIADPVTREIKRFMVGPRECEVTGLAWSPDRKTAFVGIQHPGGMGGSHFPDGGSSVPRSCVIAVVRDDGGMIG